MDWFHKNLDKFYKIYFLMLWLLLGEGLVKSLGEIATVKKYKDYCLFSYANILVKEIFIHCGRDIQ